MNRLGVDSKFLLRAHTSVSMSWQHSLRTGSFERLS